MKVLHFFNEINFSGAEIMYARAAPMFEKEGMELIAFSTGSTAGNFLDEFEKANIRVLHRPINFNPISIKGYRYYKELYLFLKMEKVDVLHIHRSDLYFSAVIAWWAGVKCIKTQHATFRNRWFTLPYAILQRAILRRLFNVCFQTIGETVYKNELKYYKNPSIQINNWFDGKTYFATQNESGRLKMRKELSISQNAFVIISTGSCSPNKNHCDVIKALSIVVKKISCIYLHLGYGEMEKNEKDLALQLELYDSIRFLGNREKVRDYLAASDVFVMSSRYEGLGNAALEAMGCKLPAILYDVPGLRDLIQNDNNGFLIKPDYRVLAEKIIYVQQHPLVAQQKAEKAHSFVNREFAMDKNVQKILSLYCAKLSLL